MKQAKYTPATSVCQACLHNKAEVLDAVQSLVQSQDYMRRLQGFARWKVYPISGRLHDSDAEDLLHEALVKTLDGTRPWQRRHSFHRHIVRCMSSIAHNWFEKAGRYIGLSDVHAYAPAFDSAIDRQARIDQLRESLQGHPMALAVLDCRLDGHSPAEARQILGIREDVYWAARKQIRRFADKVFGSPKSREF